MNGIVKTSPFPHRIIEDAFPGELIDAALAEWPNSEWPHWHVYADANSSKRASKDASRLSPAAQLLIAKMAELPISRWFDCACFPDLSLHGAGMHEITPGGFLRRHLDAERHPSMPWRRCVSAVLFMNDIEGRVGCDGALRFDGTTIRPVKNRIVMFRCTNDAWHEVNAVPEGPSRKTLAMFWWQVSQEKSARTSAKFHDHHSEAVA